MTVMNHTSEEQDVRISPLRQQEHKDSRYDKKIETLWTL